MPTDFHRLIWSASIGLLMIACGAPLTVVTAQSPAPRYDTDPRSCLTIEQHRMSGQLIVMRMWLHQSCGKVIVKVWSCRAPGQCANSNPDVLLNAAQPYASVDSLGSEAKVVSVCNERNHCT